MNDCEDVLKSLNDQLYVKNKAMEEMVARVAHELLTPITSLLMTADNLLDHFEDEQNGRTGLYSTAEIITNLERITRNGSDLKDQAIHILEGFTGSNLKSIAMNVEKAVHIAIDDFTIECQVEGIEISLNQPEFPVEVLIPIQTLKTILRNVLSNAVKFTAANKSVKEKRVDVVLIDHPLTVEIVVSDSGIGMPEEFFRGSHIYEFGSRSKESVDRAVRGYGVGLPTVKKLLDNLGGSIHFTSNLDVGTTVHISLPKGDDADEII